VRGFNSRGGKSYWNVLFDGAVEREPDDKGKFIWKLRPSLVSALKRLGTSDDKTAKIGS
jgi:hypothetical protein